MSIFLVEIKVMISILLVYFFQIVNSLEYVPGTPGAKWTADEMIIVKSKLNSIFDQYGGFKALDQIYEKNPATWQDVPDAPKALRLGFHDCLRFD